MKADKPTTPPSPTTGAMGWPLAPSVRFPGEQTLSCPECGSLEVGMTVAYGPMGRIGDLGATDVQYCGKCGYRECRASKPMEAR